MSDCTQQTGWDCIHFLLEFALKTTNTAPCALQWPVEGSRGVEVLDFRGEEGWEKLALSFWAAEDLRSELNLSKLSGHEGPEQPGQEQAGRSRRFSG